MTALPEKDRKIPARSLTSGSTVHLTSSLRIGYSQIMEAPFAALAQNVGVRPLQCTTWATCLDPKANGLYFHLNPGR